VTSLTRAGSLPPPPRSRSFRALLKPVRSPAVHSRSRRPKGLFQDEYAAARFAWSSRQSKAPRLVVTGQVLSAQCKPVANALLDFWHADEDGEYDNRGFRYRGHQFTDAEGHYRLQTIVPAEYPGRARHIHVKVQAPQARPDYAALLPGRARQPPRRALQPGPRDAHGAQRRGRRERSTSS